MTVKTYADHAGGRTGRGGIFGQGVTLNSKNIGKKLIPGQGVADGTPQAHLSRQQRRFAERQAAKASAEDSRKF